MWLPNALMPSGAHKTYILCLKGILIAHLGAGVPCWLKVMVAGC